MITVARLQPPRRAFLRMRVEPCGSATGSYLSVQPHKLRGLVRLCKEFFHLCC